MNDINTFLFFWSQQKYQNPRNKSKIQTNKMFIYIFSTTKQKKNRFEIVKKSIMSFITKYI